MHDWLPKELLIIQGTENKATPVKAESGGDYIPLPILAPGSMSFVIQDYAKTSLQTFCLAFSMEAEMEHGNTRSFWKATLIWNVFCQIISPFCMY